LLQAYFSGDSFANFSKVSAIVILHSECSSEETLENCHQHIFQKSILQHFSKFNSIFILQSKLSSKETLENCYQYIFQKSVLQNFSKVNWIFILHIELSSKTTFENCYQHIFRAHALTQPHALVRSQLFLAGMNSQPSALHIVHKVESKFLRMSCMYVLDHIQKQRQLRALS